MISELKEAIRNICILAACVIPVHWAYVDYIRPKAEQLIFVAASAGESAPREWVVLIKDWEQEICIILMIYCIVQVVLKLREIASEQYLFDVDLLEGNEDSLSSDTLEKLESLPKNITSTQLIETLISSLRRYRITGDVQDTSDAIQTSVESLSLRLEAENSTIRYLIWAIPSIGFIGTVRGIGQALSQADEALAGNITNMTASLGIAFNSTLIALLASIVLMLFLHHLQRAQDRRIVDIQSYCEEFLVKRISR